MTGTIGSFRGLLWSMNEFIVMVIGILIIGFFSGPFAYGNPFFSHMLFISLSAALPAIILQMNMLGYEKTEKSLPSSGSANFIHRTRKLAVTVVIFVALVNIPLTILNGFFIPLWIGFDPLVIPLASFIIIPFFVAILALYYQLMNFLVFISVYVDVERLSKTMQVRGNIKFIPIFSAVFLAFFVNIFFVFIIRDVFDGRILFPFPELLSLSFTILVIIYSIVTGWLMFRQAQRHIKQLPEEQPTISN